MHYRKNFKIYIYILASLRLPFFLQQKKGSTKKAFLSAAANIKIAKIQRTPLKEKNRHPQTAFLFNLPDFVVQVGASFPKFLNAFL